MSSKPGVSSLSDRVKASNLSDRAKASGQSDQVKHGSETRPAARSQAPAQGTKVGLAIGLVTSLFFIWGVTMNLVNPLRDSFGQYMHLDATQSSLLQFAYYIAFFVMAIPAGLISKRFGYKGGLISGLILFVGGSFLAIPATDTGSYWLFLLAMFVVALGDASVETNANPYIAKLGDEAHESMRLNRAQSFNAVGNVVSPIILGLIIAQTIHPDDSAEKQAFLGHIQLIYIVIGLVMVILLGIFVFVKLPTPPGDLEDEGSELAISSVGSVTDSGEGLTDSVIPAAAAAHTTAASTAGADDQTTAAVSTADAAAHTAAAAGRTSPAAATVAQPAARPQSPLRKPYVILGVVAQFVFIGLQVVGMGVFTTYAQQFGHLTSSTALLWFTGLTICFAVGRFITTPLMNKLDAAKLLGVYMAVTAVLMLVVAAGWGLVSVAAFAAAYLFISIGYPTIFALTVKGLHGQATKTASSALIMSIVGAALIPLLLGIVQDAAGLRVALLLTVPGFLFLTWYAFKGCRLGLD